MNFSAAGLQSRPLSPEELAVRLAAIVDSSEDAIIGTDASGTISTWNSAATRIFGYSPEEIAGLSVLLLVPPDLHAEELGHRERVMRGERVMPYETERLRKGGDRVRLSLAMSPIRDVSGQIIGSALNARDPGTHQRGVVAHARLAAIVESSDDAIIAKDLNGVVTDWNLAAERIFGYTAEEMVGRSILTIIPPELQHEEPAILSKIRAGERLEHYETYRLHRSGRRVDVSLTLSPIRDSLGRVIGASKIARDISERRRADRARLLLAAIVESSDDAIISKNLDGIITTWNASAERLFGYKPEEIIGQSVMRLIPRELYHEEPWIISRLSAGVGIDHFETRRMRKSGEIFHVSLTVSPIKDKRGTVIGASKIVRDITERKVAEAALIEKEKFAAMGRLAATLAHEVNNPLEAITNLSFLLAHHSGLDPEARGWANQLLHEVQRAGDITRQTLSYYKTTRRLSDVDITEVLEHLLRWKQKKLQAKGIELVTDFASVPLVSGFAGELRQVFENLVENAMDAVKDGGHIRIRTRTRGRGEAKKLVVSICDNGAGISRATMSKIFDPFFTTKTENGSGLGLWVSLGIVQKHGGTIRARSSQSESGSGTVFTVTLPARNQAGTEPRPNGATAQAA